MRSTFWWLFIWMCITLYFAVAELRLQAYGGVVIFGGAFIWLFVEWWYEGKRRRDPKVVAQ